MFNRILSKFRATGKAGKVDESNKPEKSPKEEDLDELSLRDAFDRFDINGDGVIDKEELSKLLIEFLELPKPPTEKQLSRIMAKVDLDQNGTIDYEEFKQMMHGRSDTKNQYLTTFKNFDLDNDGYITQKELAECMKKVHPDTTDEEIEVIMEALDSNKDGKISFQEFLNYFVG